MSDLLLITDIPRLRKLFLRLAEDRSLSLRVAGSLEKGDEEIVVDKPAMVFVQTHLSGLSADILLMHFKKLLGRRRTRFVLLSPVDQVNDGVIKLYHNFIDTSLDDHALVDAIMATVATLAPKGKKTGASSGDMAAGGESSVASSTMDETGPSGGETDEDSPVEPPVPVSEPGVDAPLEPGEPSLEEQGVVYALRPQLSVYSEFTGTYDSAVSQVSVPEPAAALLEEPMEKWRHGEEKTFRAEASRSRSKSFRYMLWLVALVVASVAVTLYQYHGSQTNTLESVPESSSKSAGRPRAVVSQPGEPAKAPPATTPPKPVADGRLDDKAVISTIAESQGSKQQKPSAPAVARPTVLPDFIPRGGLDKGFGAANPGWELYRGVVTEFKVFREGTAIKAIQIIDRGGQGIPETFMKGVLGHLAKQASFSPTSSEKKEGYDIQRGQVAGNLSAVFYRDAQGGKLRAFVVTWQ
ncbi:MAG: hypothetical protein HXX11_05270 [Desulfuromonadales bacterium]|nr:hypothetical protein [Desulfuromonadales bacterium]